MEQEDKIDDLLYEQLQNTPKNYFRPHKNKIEDQKVECLVCKKCSKYVCPKCQEFYCSLKCYKEHGQGCTEKFYEENCKQYLKGLKADPQKIKDFKQKMYQEKKNLPDAYDELFQIKQERLEELLALVEENQLDLNELTESEKKEFLDFVQKQQIQEWSPFWMKTVNIPSLFVMEQQNTQGKKLKKRIIIVQRFQTIPQIKVIETLKPDSQVGYHILSTIMCCVFRLYNGDIFSDLQDSISTFEVACPLIFQNKHIIYSNVKFTLSNCEQNFSQELLIFILIAIDDLIQIYDNLFLVVEFIFKVYDAYHALENQLGEQLSKALFDDQIKQTKLKIKQIYQIKQKLIFYIAFLKKMKTKYIDPVRCEIMKYKERKQRFQENKSQLGKAKQLDLII